MAKYRTHAFIPDPQNKAHTPVNHLRAAGNYLADKRPDVIILAGDWWDLSAFSSYDTDAAKVAEGLSYAEDIAAGRRALDVFLKPIQQASRRWKPDIHFLHGNHENRLVTQVQATPMLRGLLGFESFGLRERGLKVHPFLKPAIIDQIAYCHYFNMDSNGRVMNSKRGQASARAQVNNVGMSATSGHKQGLDVYVKESPAGRRRGLIAGSFYQHAEAYLGPQGNAHWHGILLKHEVRAGDYDLLEVSLEYLLRKWT